MPLRHLPSVPSNEEIKEKLLMCAGFSPRDRDLERAMAAVDILLPQDDKKWAYNYLTTKTQYGYVSNCAIFAQYYYQLKVLGMETDNNTTPYSLQLTQIFSDMIHNAQEFDAWVTSRDELKLPPEPGDIIHSGEGMTTHASCVVDYDPKTQTVFCVDGGQVDNTWIMERERAWKWDGTKAMLGTKPIKGYQRIRILRAQAENAVSDTDPPTP